jgi:hypothetical protein
VGVLRQVRIAPRGRGVGGAEEAASESVPDIPPLECHDPSPLSSFVPHSRNYGGQARQDALYIDIQGLKPLAESFHPFGISPAGPDRMRHYA